MVRHLSIELEEKSIDKLAMFVNFFGVGPTELLLERTLEVERSGGRWTKDKSKRRSAGGVGRGGYYRIHIFDSCFRC